MSRQREHQKKRKLLGLCQNCTNALNLYTYLCDECMQEHKVRVRNRNAYNAWIEGRPGRPPQGLDYHNYKPKPQS